MTVASNCAIQLSNKFGLKELKQVINKIVYPNLFKLFQVALPISFASCERSFSAMRRIKSWTRTTMGQERLSDLSIIHIESDINIKSVPVLLQSLRPIEVIDCFTDELMTIRPTGDKRIEEFMDYVFDNYISPEASFPPSMWAQFSTTLNRTTNSCESYHPKLNGCFYSGHPNIFVFINELLEVQPETYIKCRSNGNNKSKKQQEKQIF
ncbi:hypothetical protein QTP88_020204 [Uroleucon formosanum]